MPPVTRETIIQWAAEILDEYKAENPGVKVDMALVNYVINKAIRNAPFDVVAFKKRKQDAKDELWDAGFVESVIKAQREFGKFVD